MEEKKEDKIKELENKISQLKEQFEEYRKSGGTGLIKAAYAYREINELELKKEDLINGTNNYAIEGKKREIEKLINLRKEASLIGKIKYIRRLRKEEQALEELQNKNKQR